MLYNYSQKDDISNFRKNGGIKKIVILMVMRNYKLKQGLLLPYWLVYRFFFAIKSTVLDKKGLFPHTKCGYETN